jgi:hypothetical protein
VRLTPTDAAKGSGSSKCRTNSHCSESSECCKGIFVLRLHLSRCSFSGNTVTSPISTASSPPPPTSPRASSLAPPPRPPWVSCG